MHFTGWKLGLKTGMYYLRTMAASAPIQFTVDQEQLKVVDTNVARERYAPRKRTSLGFNSTYAAIPRPYALKNPSHGSTSAVNGIPTPAATPPVGAEKQLVQALERTRLSDGSSSEEPSPKVLAIEPIGMPDQEESLDANIKKFQAEDEEIESNEREGDIYSEAVLACESKMISTGIPLTFLGSIENREACLMCSS